MRVEIFSQVVFDLARYANQYATLEEEEDAANCAGAENLERGESKPRPGNFAPVCIYGLANNNGDIKVANDAGEDASNAKYQLELVGTEIAPEFS